MTTYVVKDDLELGRAFGQLAAAMHLMGFDLKPESAMVVRVDDSRLVDVLDTLLSNRNDLLMYRLEDIQAAVEQDYADLAEERLAQLGVMDAAYTPEEVRAWEKVINQPAALFDGDHPDHEAIRSAVPMADLVQTVTGVDQARDEDQTAVEVVKDGQVIALAVEKKRRGRKTKLQAQPVPAELPKEDRPTCPSCGQFYQRTAPHQMYCKRPECKAERARKHMAATRDRKVRAALNKELIEAQMPAAEPSAQEIIPVEDVAADSAAGLGEKTGDIVYQPDAGDLADLNQDLIPEPEANPVMEVKPETPQRKPGEDWLIEDGPRAGEYMTKERLWAALASESLRPGQHLTHRKTGQHKVIKPRGKHGLQLQRLFGPDAPKVLSSASDFGA